MQAVRQRLLAVTCTCARPTSEQHRGVWYSCLLTLIVREISNLQARFLLAKLNPSATYNTSSAVSSEIIMTDDVSLQVRPGVLHEQLCRGWAVQGAPRRSLESCCSLLMPPTPLLACSLRHARRSK